MDSGFDDLLAPSRDALENPFGDPFSKPRSGSPDPWASAASVFGNTTVPSFNEDQPWGSSSPTTLTHSHDAFVHTGGFHEDVQEEELEEVLAPAAEAPHVEQSSVDPLDTAAFNAAEAEAEAEAEAAAAAAKAKSMLTRGFRESISTEAEAEEPLQAKEPEPEPAREATPTPPAEEPPKSSTPPPAPVPQPSAPEVPARALGHASQGSTASFTSQPKAEPAAFNPLNQPQSSLERSIAGLSIGGEAIGGWEGSGGWQTQTNYSIPAPVAGASRGQSVSDDDDDDDDRPIAQTLAARAAARQSEQGMTSVSVMSLRVCTRKPQLWPPLALCKFDEEGEWASTSVPDHR